MPYFVCVINETYGDPTHDFRRWSQSADGSHFDRSLTLCNCSADCLNCYDNVVAQLRQPPPTTTVIDCDLC